MDFYFSSLDETIAWRNTITQKENDVHNRIAHFDQSKEKTQLKSLRKIRELALELIASNVNENDLVVLASAITDFYNQNADALLNKSFSDKTMQHLQSKEKQQAKDFQALLASQKHYAPLTFPLAA